MRVELLTLAGTDLRTILFQAKRAILGHYAWRAETLKKWPPGTYLVLCIHRDDPAWKTVADHLAPENVDWETYRKRGEIPLAIGTVERKSFIRYLKRLEASVAVPKARGKTAIAVICAGGGFSCHNVVVQPVH